MFLKLNKCEELLKKIKIEGVHNVTKQDIDNCVDENKNTIYHLIAKQNDLDTFNKLMENKLVSEHTLNKPNSKKNGMNTALHILASKDEQQQQNNNCSLLMEQLLISGANPKIKNLLGQTINIYDENLLQKIMNIEGDILYDIGNKNENKNDNNSFTVTENNVSEIFGNNNNTNKQNEINKEMEKLNNLFDIVKSKPTQIMTMTGGKKNKIIKGHRTIKEPILTESENDNFLNQNGGNFNIHNKAIKKIMNSIDVNETNASILKNKIWDNIKKKYNNLSKNEQLQKLNIFIDDNELFNSLMIKLK